MVEAPPGVNLDFYANTIHPSTPDDQERFNRIWNESMDHLDWNEIPLSHKDPLASWTYHSDLDTEITLMPSNCWGNTMVWRENWLRINAGRLRHVG